MDAFEPKAGDSLRASRLVRAIVAEDTTSIGQVLTELSEDPRGAVVVAFLAARTLGSEWVRLYGAQMALEMMDAAVVSDMEALGDD